MTIDTQSNKVLSRKKLDESKEHFFLNISTDTATHRAFITDSKQPQVLVVDTRNGNILSKIDVPESLAVLFNPARNEVYVTHRRGRSERNRRQELQGTEHHQDADPPEQRRCRRTARRCTSASSRLPAARKKPPRRTT